MGLSSDPQAKRTHGRAGAATFSNVRLDTVAPLHHGVGMRLTINLDDDLYAMARTHAIVTKTSLSRAVGDLLRRRVAGDMRSGHSSGDPEPDFRIDPETLLPVVRGCGKPIGNDDVRIALDDDDARHLSHFPTTPNSSPR